MPALTQRLPRLHMALNGRWARQEPIRIPNPADRDQRTHPAALHRLSVKQQRLHHPEGESPVAPQLRQIHRVSLALVAQREVGAHDEGLHPQITLQPGDELLGARDRSLGREGVDHSEIQSKGPQVAKPLFEAREKSEWNVRLQDLERMGIERHDAGQQVAAPGFGDHLFHQMAVTEVHSIENSNRDRRSTIQAGALRLSDHLHSGEKTLVGRHFPECTSKAASARNRPLPLYTRTSPLALGFASTP